MIVGIGKDFFEKPLEEKAEETIVEEKPVAKKTKKK